MDAIELYYSLSAYPLADFGTYFSNFRKTAFRLEMLKSYSVPEEVEPFAAFQRGELVLPAGFNKDWHDILERASGQGKNFSRVRFVNEPIGDYFRFEVKWGYEANVLKGENINFLILDDICSAARAVPILKDYWLFDDSTCFLMDYDSCGRFLGVVKLSDELVPKYSALARDLTNLSVSFTKGKKSLGLA